MDELVTKPIGQIVAQDFRTARVFRQFGLEFCCGGGQTIDEAVSGSEVEAEEVRQALQQISADKKYDHHYNEWSLDFLVDYIINNHHKFSRNVLPQISEHAKKVASVHGENHPELNEIYHIVVQLHADIFNHLDKEEEILFPYIKELTEADGRDEHPPEPDFQTAENPIVMMEEEHEDSAEAIAEIRELSNGFTPPKDACTTYKLLYQELENFEQDLHKHVHLENNILFPKALELEKRLN